MYNLTNKTILITGANAGIGKAAALQMAQLGAQVVVMCRSAERGAQAVEDIQRKSGNDRVELVQVDLASQASVRRAACETLERFQRIDVLVHNAANFDLAQKKPILTADGIETIFATNHLGPFLLTQLLLDRLKASAPSRIITVASKGLVTFPRLDIEFDNLNGERKYSPTHAYYHSKQAQVIFTYDLAERLRGSGVTVNCVRVGNVAVPDERLPQMPGWLLKIYKLKRKAAMTPEKMAETYTWLAGDPALETMTGGYYDAPNAPVKANRYAYNPQTWQQLWKASERLTQGNH